MNPIAQSSRGTPALNKCQRVTLKTRMIQEACNKKNLFISFFENVSTVTRIYDKNLGFPFEERSHLKKVILT